MNAAQMNINSKNGDTRDMDQENGHEMDQDT